MMAEPMKRPKVFRQTGFRFYPIDGTAVLALLPVRAGENVAIVCPGWSGFYGVAVAFSPPRDLFVKKGKLLFQEFPDGRRHWYGSVLSSLRIGDDDQIVLEVDVPLFEAKQFPPAHSGKHGDLHHSGNVLPGPVVQSVHQPGRLLWSEKFGFGVMDLGKLNSEGKAWAQFMLCAMVDNTPEKPQGMISGGRRQFLFLHVALDSLDVQL